MPFFKKQGFNRQGKGCISCKNTNDQTEIFTLEANITAYITFVLSNFPAFQLLVCSKDLSIFSISCVKGPIPAAKKTFPVVKKNRTFNLCNAHGHGRTAFGRQHAPGFSQLLVHIGGTATAQVGHVTCGAALQKCGRHGLNGCGNPNTSD